MSPSTWTDADTQRAQEIWAEYQRQHDVSSLRGKAVGIDPANGRVWFGESATDIWRQRQAETLDSPIYCIRVGYDYYVRKGRSHR
ncbi:MAG: hypothetical protein ACLQGP_05435 [Isosphaeraceae bacterium]